MDGSAGWSLEQVGGGRLEAVNRTGQLVYDVRLSSHGAVVVAGQRNWGWSLPAVEAGRALSFSFALPGAAYQDPPHIRVEYKLSSDEDAPVYEDRFNLL